MVSAPVCMYCGNTLTRRNKSKQQRYDKRLKALQDQQLKITQKI